MAIYQFKTDEKMKGYITKDGRPAFLEDIVRDLNNYQAKLSKIEQGRSDNE